jgi:hypothetical protein
VVMLGGNKVVVILEATTAVGIFGGRITVEVFNGKLLTVAIRFQKLLSYSEKKE